MTLRKLEKKDAPLMLEWMHCANVVQYLNTDFEKKTIEDCLSFIEAAEHDINNINLAIVDENDEYLGTVSLKHIDPRHKVAEFAITIRSCAMGTGYAHRAMRAIMQMGFDKLQLRKIYWCVSPRNERAIRFYDKNNYQKIESPKKVIGYKNDIAKELIWYGVEAEKKLNE